MARAGQGVKAGATAPPLPAWGERVGVWGTFSALGLSIVPLTRPPSLRYGGRPRIKSGAGSLPASGERWKRRGTRLAHRALVSVACARFPREASGRSARARARAPGGDHHRRARAWLHRSSPAGGTGAVAALDLRPRALPRGAAHRQIARSQRSQCASSARR
jgi:hypothetical protein